MAMSDKAPMIPLTFERYPEEEMARRAEGFLERMRARRSVRQFSSEPVPIEVVERCIEAAAQAPSGANKQPWTFVVVTDPELKRQIREAAEREEAAFYSGRASQRWLDDLAHLGTTPDKPFLELAPALVVVFAQRHGGEASDRHYYVSESVGIATGLLLAALHNAGIATLVHTPSPMKFLSQILGRPANEAPLVLIPVGYPSDDCQVPAIERKPLDQVLVRNRG